MADDSESWALKEFKNINLGDKRLNNRLIKLADDFSKHPDFSINQASKDWHAAKAAYRFFQNDKISIKNILQPHFKNTAERCKKQKIILIVQDTSVIGLSHHPKTKGLGRIGGHSKPVDNVHGIYMHTALALTTQGMPLGLLSNTFGARTEEKKYIDKKHNSFIPTEEKESYKWINALEQSHEVLGGEVESITICDRECDNYDFYLNAIDLETNVVVRLRHDRDVGTRNKPIPLTEKLKQSSAYKNKIIIKVPIEILGAKDNSKSTKYRNAELELKSIPITLAPSRKQSQVIKENINLYAVEAKEINPPDGLEAAHWILITTLEINSYEKSLMIVNCYSMRWKIENYFRVLKSGCTIEECRLGEAQRMIKYIALNSVIAWRIFWMTFVSRVSPEESCEVALTKSEWQTLYCYFNEKSIAPDKSPTIHQAIIWLARLGGFLARKNDGNPGPTYLWRGWSRLQDMANMQRILKKNR